MRHNLDQEVIITTKDKVELALRRTLPGYTSTEQLIASVSLLAGLVLALCASDFKRFAGVPAAGWQAVFGVAAGAAGIWTIREIWRWLRRPDLDDVVREIVHAADNPGL